MSYDGQFRRIDPIHGKLTDSMHIAIIAKRARALLTARSAEEMEAAARFIDGVLDQGSGERMVKRNSDSVVVPMPDDEIYEADALVKLFKVHKAGENPDFTDGQPYEYFAVLALSHAIDASLYHDGWYAARPPWSLDEWPEGSEQIKESVMKSHRDPAYRGERASRHAMEALTAISLAEQLYSPLAPEISGLAETAYLGETVRLADRMAEVRAVKNIAKQNSRNGSKSHAKHRQMKEQAKSWWTEHRAEYRYSNHAVSAFIKIVPVEARTAEEWFREFKQALPPLSK
jgi:hypothetical protein